MKTCLYSLFISVALVTTTSAAPKLILDTLVTDADGHGKDRVLAHFHVLTKNRKKTVLLVGKYRYAVTPILRDDGSVDVVAFMTHPNNQGKDWTIGPYKQNGPLGEPRNISFGSTTYAAKVSLAK